MGLENPLTFLELCQRTRQDCGVSGTGPVTVVNQTGEMQRIVTWVGAAWDDVQRKHTDWQFKRVSTSWITALGQANYTTVQCGIAAGLFGKWQRDTFRNYVTAVGLNSEVFMDYMEYDVWRNNYLFGALRDTRTRPVVASIGPDKSINLGPVPIDGYTISGDYYRGPIAMAGDAATPDLLPPQFNLIIVFGAMMYYGVFQSAPEVYQQGKLGYDRLMGELEVDRLPEVRFDGALA